MTTDDLRTRAREAAEEKYPDPMDDSLTYPHSAVRGFMRAAFIKGTLWHAAQQPTVDELVVVHDAVCVCDHTTHPAEYWANRERSARAVVAHLTKGDKS